MKNLICPYCNKKVSYYMGLLERKQGEHTCNSCGKNSTIFYNTSIKVIAFITILISIGLFVLWYMFFDHNYILGILTLLIPFLIFLVISPLFIKLIPLKIHNKKIKSINEDPTNYYNNEDYEENNPYKKSLIDYNDYVNKDDEKEKTYAYSTSKENNVNITKEMPYINELDFNINEEDEYVDINSL